MVLFSRKFVIWVFSLFFFLLVLVSVPYFFSLDSKQSHFGNFGGYFGGVLGPLLSFFTIILIIKQNDDLEKREQLRDYLAHLDFKNEQFFRDLNFLERKFQMISYEDQKGFAALFAFTNKLNKDQKPKVPAILSAPSVSCIVMLSIILKDIFYGYVTQKSIMGNKDIIKKQYEYVKNTISFVDLLFLYGPVKLANESIDISFIERIIDHGSKNEQKYPSLDDEDLILKLLSSS